MSAPRGPRVSPVVAGAGIALLAVLAGSFFSVAPPPAYGICVACHARDLVTWLVDLVPGVRLNGGPAGPLLTVVGLLIGAHLGARQAGEYRPRRAGRPVRQFALGLLTMVFSLVALGCTTRLVLRAAYGDRMAFWALGAAAAGVAAATGLLAWRARRGAA